MSTILVTGAGGGLGSNVVRAALERGHTVRALVRNPEKAKLPDGVVPLVCDALELESMRRAADGCEAVFHLANVVIGDDWVRVTSALLDAAIAACASTGARLVFPANVWVFGHGTRATLVAEDARLTPCSKLGEVRRHKEERIRAAGIRWTMLRLPEFYGPYVQTLTGRPLQAIARGRRGLWWGPRTKRSSSCTCPTRPQRWSRSGWQRGFPELTMTSYDDGIATTLAWHRANADARTY